MSSLYPLRFHPILRRYLWGGRGLQTALGKPLGEGTDYAESWEIADRGTDQSIVAQGPLAGQTLGQLTRERGAELFGGHHPPGRFPLLMKFLDAHQPLSLQVHPNDALAALRTPADFGKTEAWVILDAAPGSYLYAGLRRGFDRQLLERELARGTCELCVERFEPKAGDCFYLPAGALHALGPGLLVVELQQSSDVTHRLFDWNRLGPDGRPRPLHVEEGLSAIDYQLGPLPPRTPEPFRPNAERLVACEKFVWDRWRFDQPETFGGDERFHIVTVLAGSVIIEGDPAGEPLGKGAVALLPASVGPIKLSPQTPTILLDAYLP